MDYSLAKELKEAGFTQRYFKTEEYYHDAAVPTLAELIEACGDEFEGLERLVNNLWGAYTDTKERPENAIGETPEEAVALLWLALNRK